jgi:uncharacterized protein (TIGR03066 family)
MELARLMGTAFIMCVLAVGIRAEDNKDNAKLVVGKWEVIKAAPGTLPVGAVIDLTKGDKAKVTAKRDDKEVIHEGTYKVDGDKIVIAVKVEGEEQKHILAIKKISDTEMVTEHGEGKTIEFKRNK